MSKKELGRRIEEFVDYFQSKGLSTIISGEPSSLLGTAILWKESGYLVSAESNFTDVKEVECSNGIVPWTKASFLGKDRALDLAVLKLDASILPSIKNYIRWADRFEGIVAGEVLSVVSAAYPGQVDRFSVETQPFGSSMHTGIDEDLILFLPPISDVSAGGLLVDSSFRVLGYLIAHQSSLWGVAISIRRAEYSVTSIIEKGSVPQPYAGLKLRFQEGSFIVQQIEVGSPSYRAGLRVDDVVVKWNHRDLKALSDWQEMSVKDINRAIALTYRRGDKLIESSMNLTASE